MKRASLGFCFLAAEREWVRIDASLAPERVTADIKTVLLGPLWPGSFIRRLGQN
jgi:hypothetical protein